MDNSSKKIISIITMDKRETGKKSTNMEKGCFLKAMEDLRDNGVVVAEVVTDAHLQIGAVMSKCHFIKISLLLLNHYVLSVLQILS